jgi:transposase
MTRTAESIVETHQIARALVRSGRNPWTYKLKIYVNDNWSFEKKRDTIAEALKNSSWFKVSSEEGQRFSPEDSEIYQLWDEMKDADNEDHFDLCWDAVYDLADYERCAISLQIDYDDEEKK